MQKAQDDKLATMFGEKLLRGKDQSIDTIPALRDCDAIGIYFSAHWCPPCRGFTPVLGKRYEALKAAGKKVEIIFVSSDRNEEAFNEYFETMPFLALQYSDRERKEKLSQKFEVSGIPTLVFVDNTGSLITKKGRNHISDEATFIEKFPYRPKVRTGSVLAKMFGHELLRQKGEKVATDDALGNCDAIGIYFSAHWCPPCRGFTPVLGKRYEALKAAGKKVEIVFASSDSDENAFSEYFDTMPFLALPYEDRELKEELSERFGVRGIPTLVFVDCNGETITTEGRSAVSNEETFIDDFPYHPKPVYDLADSTSGLNDRRCMIVFMDGADESEQTELEASLLEIAEAAFQTKEEDRKGAQRFFTAKGGGPISQIRRGCGLPVPIAPHKHELVNIGNENKRWGCDGCGKSGFNVEARHQCGSGCNFDYCGECLEKSKQKPTAEQKQVRMAMLDLGDSGSVYVHPATIEVTPESMKEFAAALAAGSVEKQTWSR